MASKLDVRSSVSTCSSTEGEDFVEDADDYDYEEEAQVQSVPGQREGSVLLTRFVRLLCTRMKTKLRQKQALFIDD
jgi:hypothetical protein